MDKSIIDPFVQVSVHIPDWVRPGSSSNGSNGSNGTPSPNGNEIKRKTADPEALVSSPLGDIDPSNILTSNSGDPNDPQLAYARPARVLSNRTSVIKDNGFNPVWEELVSITFDVVGDMKDLVFVRFTIKDEGDDEENRPIAVYCSSLGSLRQGKVSGIKSVHVGELTETVRRLSTPAIVRSATFTVFILHALRAHRVEGSYILVESVRNVGPIIAFSFCQSCGTIIVVYLD